MKEKQWLHGTDPTPMLRFALGKLSDRKLRLFAVACCRDLQRSWPSPPEYDGFLEWAELFADGQARPEELAAIGHEVADYADDYAPAWWTGIARAIACAVRLPAADPLGIREATLQVLAYDRLPGADWSAEQYEEFARQAALLREVVGPLSFRPVVIDPAWQTPPVMALAREMYDGRAFARMPRLADALAEAGCTDAEVLDHCRRAPGQAAGRRLRGERLPETGPAIAHVRGCWVVDLLLGKD